MSAPLISYRGVYKAYGQHLVLRNINLDVPEHTVTCLIGASGCGKSTLLRCTNLLEEIQHGSITLRGRDIAGAQDDADAIRKQIGMVFQSYNLFPHMSVLKNITLSPVKVLGKNRSEAEDRARELLGRFGLADKANEYPDRLSGGQQQRVAVIRALAMEPDVLLLDEITSALDPEMVGEVMDIIVELKSLGMTMIMATHQMGFASQIADNVVFLDQGIILEQGHPSTFFANPQNARTKQFLERVTSAL
ncbi:MAG TPA: amino acid ABC transporter ATP-binding protein [Thermomicrobiales bacterium]|jgi:polar amino acid transport system ATP-binding protein|nr:amino acid ABC transporter ATP-binding protein [Thermomicrobiales bacterium]